MDYSAVSSEADALHGSSPWGSSSPRADRTFPAATTPDSPASIRGHSYNQSQDSLPNTPYLPASSVESPTETSHHPEGEAAHEEGDNAPEDGQAPTSGQQYGGQAQQRPQAARYHSTKPQRPVPQYRLQAKVTALERTGRKDPVIRFDVYVCCCVPHDARRYMLTGEDQSAQISNDPVPRRPPNTL